MTAGRGPDGPDRLPVPHSGAPSAGPVPPPERARPRAPRWLRRPLRRAGCLLVLFVGAVLVLTNVVSGLFGDDNGAGSDGSAALRDAPAIPPSSGSRTLDLILARERLVVAVQERSGLAARDNSTQRWSGFDVEIARLVAAELGVDPARTAFKPLDGRARQAALVEGDADLVLGYAADAARAQQAEIAGPYLSAPRRLLVPAGSPVRGIGTLGEQRVCAAEDSPVAEQLAASLGDRLITRSTTEQCVSRLGREAGAVAGDEPELRALAAAEPGALTVIGDPIGSTDYVVGLAPGDEVLRARVNDVLRRAIADGTWARLYEQHLGAPVPVPPPVGR